METSYHLFGDLYLDPPEQYLPEEGLEQLKRVKSLLERFALRQQKGGRMVSGKNT